MENKEAIEKLERQSKLMCHGCMHPLPEVFNMAISALEKQEQNRWIPVTEKGESDGSV